MKSEKPAEDMSPQSEKTSQSEKTPNDDSIFNQLMDKTKKMFSDDTPNDDHALNKLWQMANDLAGSLGITLDKKQLTAMNEKLTHVSKEDDVYEQWAKWIKDLLQQQQQPEPAEKEGICDFNVAGSVSADANMW